MHFFTKLQPVARRLVDGMAAAITERSYAATTIADVVRHAHVSKRTFYEHFLDKDACFRATYAALAEEALTAIAGAVDYTQPWNEQIHAATRAYLRYLEERPALARTFMLEIHAGGPEALKMRRQVHKAFADLLQALVAGGLGQNAHLHGLSPPMATALVGAINELVLVQLEREAASGLTELEGTVAHLVRAVLTVQPEGAA